MAFELDIYAYDAYMIECARNNNAPLLTLDTALISGSYEEYSCYGDRNMTIYSFSEAQQKFDLLLNKAVKEGKVFIRRNDGTVFSLTPEKKSRSPLGVEGITTNVSTD